MLLVWKLFPLPLGPRQKKLALSVIFTLPSFNPRMIGFGISNAQTLKAAQDNAAGAIIGSKFVTLLNEANGNADTALDRLFEALEK